MKNEQKQILFWGLVLLFLSTANLTFALEAKYPQLPGLPFITDRSGLPELIQYFFGIGIAFAGAVALVSLAIAGVQIIIGQANPEGVSNAKDRIKGSLLGIVLIMVSFLILKSINPVLITPTITKLTDNPGIFYINLADKQEIATPSQETDTDSIPTGFDNMEYRCNRDSSGNVVGPNLLVWVYPKENFGDYINAKTHELSCGGFLPTNSGKSFKMAFKTSGAYYYLSEGCSSDGYRSDVVLTSGQLPEQFRNIAGGSIKFVNNPSDNIYYGMIFHDNLDQSGGGNCQAPLFSDKQPESCKPITIQASSETLFSWNPEPLTSGNGVDFYSRPYGFDTKGADAGVYWLEDSKITSPFKLLDPNFMDFNYYGSGVSAEEEAGYPDFESSPGSIKINGDYIVAIYSSSVCDNSCTPGTANQPCPNGGGMTRRCQPDGTWSTCPGPCDPNKTYCQVFNQDVVDMEGTEYIGSGDNKMKAIYVIPVK